MPQAVREDSIESGYATARTPSCTYGYQARPGGPAGVSLGSGVRDRGYAPQTVRDVYGGKTESTDCNNSSKKAKEAIHLCNSTDSLRKRTRRKDGKHVSKRLGR